MSLVLASECRLLEVKEQQVAILGNHWSRVDWPSSRFAQRNHNATICTNGLLETKYFPQMTSEQLSATFLWSLKETVCLDRQKSNALGNWRPKSTYYLDPPKQERRGISIINVWDDQADGGGGSVLPQRDCCQPVAAWTMVCLPPPGPSCNDTD